MGVGGLRAAVSGVVCEELESWRAKTQKNTVFSPCEQKHTKNTVQYKRPAERARGGALVRHVSAGCAQTRGRMLRVQNAAAGGGAECWVACGR